MSPDAVAPFIAVTDKAWFDFLSSRSDGGHLDEVNFWSPRATRSLKRMALGEPVFFRLKAPVNAIAGYGFFAHSRSSISRSHGSVSDGRTATRTGAGFVSESGRTALPIFSRRTRRRRR